MIELYYWPTPNGHKVTLFLEETGLPYAIKPVNIGRGDQFEPAFLAISPNNRMPAIVDTEPKDGQGPLSVFESGAILQYLADKTGKFLPTNARARYAVLEWVYWQVGGLGPMLGQNHHFNRYAAEKIPYAIDRYVNETRRLYGVLDKRLDGRQFIAGDDYTIADMAAYPWIVPHEAQGMDLADFPHLKAWYDRIAARPATLRAYAAGEPLRSQQLDLSKDEEARKVLFGQGAKALG
ncbi:MAG TPA: glutathione binding-like protein [Dyella sp.]|uniref:glutathione binding-like protein n=1 Tax=Dyella sp. TaxID=1869338 RepID=UPI002F929399